MRVILPSILAVLLLAGAPEAQEQEPFVWRVTLDANTTAPSDITVSNRCRKSHQFQVIPENVPFLEISETQAKVKGGGDRTVPVRFNTNGLQPGVHEGQVVVACLTCAKERTCTQDRDVLPVVLTVPGTPASSIDDDPCKTTNCDELLRVAEAREAEAKVAEAAAEKAEASASKAEQAATDAGDAATRAEEAAKDDPSDYRARVNDQEYSSADTAYLEVLRARNNAALAAGEISVEQHQSRARELTAKKAREERLANKKKLKAEAKKERKKADAARKAADEARAAADADRAAADTARAAADAARKAYDDCVRKAEEECRKKKEAAEKAEEEAREIAAAAEQKRIDDEKRRIEQEQRLAREEADRIAEREHIEYLLHNIKELGLIDSEGIGNVPSLWQWLPDILETPASVLLEQQGAVPIPTDTLKALGGLYGLLGKLLDPCTALGKRKTVERLQGMTNTKTGRKYTLNEALQKTEEMCRLLNRLKSKLEELRKAEQAK